MNRLRRPLLARAGLLALFAVAALFTVARPAAAQSVDPGDCAWPIKADPDRVNVAFPDEAARYWATPFEVAPGTSMTIRGRFPDARYLSFHIYEGSMPLDALADVELVPDRGSPNPFLAGADRSSRGTYTIRVVYGKRPADAPPNTLYAESLNGEPNVAGLILYRTYLPEGDQYGRAGLPRVSYGSSDPGEPSSAPLPSCQDVVPVQNGTINEALRGQSAPAGPGSSDPPAWGISRSRPSSQEVGPATVRQGGVFFPNFHNVYLSLLARRDQGEVVAFRAKAPTFASTRGAAFMPLGQVRYWSICTNDFPTTRYVACLEDQRIKTDADGYFTMVLSDPDHKPRLGPSDNWLPTGPYPDTFVLYRQMLPAPGFAEAIERSPSAEEAPKSMRAFYPTTKICPKAAFEKDRCGLPTAAARPSSSPAPASRTSTPRCRSAAVLRLPRGLRRVRARIDGRRTSIRVRGRRAVVDLHHARTARVRLTITARRAGRPTRLTRTVRRCR